MGPKSIADYSASLAKAKKVGAPRVSPPKVNKRSVASVAKRSPGKRSPIQTAVLAMPQGALKITGSEPMYKTRSQDASPQSSNIKRKATDKPLCNASESKAARALIAASGPVPDSPKRGRLSYLTIPSLPSEDSIPSRPRNGFADTLKRLEGAHPNRSDRPGKVTTKRTNLPLAALQTLGLVEDETRVLTMTETNGGYRFVASSNARKTSQQAIDCADNLRKNPLIGAYLPSDDFLTVADLNLALEMSKER